MLVGLRIGLTNSQTNRQTNGLTNRQTNDHQRQILHRQMVEQLDSLMAFKKRFYTDNWLNY